MVKLYKICECCGNEFLTDEKNKDKKFCSMRCSSIVMRKNKMLSNLKKHYYEYKEIAKRKLPNKNIESKLIYEKDGVWSDSIDKFDYQNKTIVVCKTCMRKFIYSGKKNIPNFCSRQCYHQSKQKTEMLVCLNCEKEYKEKTTNKCYSQFCCDECEKSYYDKIEKGLVNLTKTQGKRYCINCDKKFYDIRSTSVEFCSESCKREFGYKKSLKTVICKQCNNKFETYNNSEFCSTSCASKFNYNENTKIKNIGKKAWNKGLTKYTCKTIEKNCEKQSASMCRSILNGNINITVETFHGYVEEFGHNVRSGWEYNFAKILIYLNRDYQYEKHIFKLSNGKSYIPDFYDVKRNIFYEIKGQLRKDAKEKIEIFRKDYPNIKLHLIDRKKYTIIYNKYKDILKLFKLNYNDVSKVGFVDKSVFSKFIDKNK